MTRDFSRARAVLKLGATKATKAVWLAFALTVLIPVHAQQQPSVQPSKLVRAPMIQSPPRGEVEALPIRGNLFVLFGAGGNITVSVGSDGVLMVDAGTANLADKVLAAIQGLQRDWAGRNEPKTIGWGAETRSSVVDRTRSLYDW